MSADSLRERMNALGRRRLPFVWGIDFDCRHGFLTDCPADPHNGIRWHVRGCGNSEDLPKNTAAKPRMTVVSTPSADEYSRMFGTVMAGLRRGDSFLTNLTAGSQVDCDCSLEDIFRNANAPYRLLLDDDFVCFSPEPFVRIADGNIYTYPMKGTADATIENAESLLLGDYKELCEHHTIVDLMRNDLNSVACDVAVRRFRYVERIDTADGAILQTSSEISGRLPREREFEFGDIIMPLLPAGSITGAPKEATVRLIHKAETMPRGWYTGVFGYFDGRVMDTAVMIRCIQRGADGLLYFHSGGGITVNSVCDEERDELIAKVYLTR
ncbi:MAG: aminodeoxychorismate synthase component I [Muribaculaceae bacterium]|nr:aminodeoxychorismate synthase component I [Muribaculaceae bacterium]